MFVVDNVVVVVELNPLCEIKLLDWREIYYFSFFYIIVIVYCACARGNVSYHDWLELLFSMTFDTYTAHQEAQLARRDGGRYNAT